MSAVDARTGLTFADRDAVLRSLSTFMADLDKLATGDQRFKHVAASVGRVAHFVQRLFPAVIVPVAAALVGAAAVGAAQHVGRRMAARAVGEIRPLRLGSIDSTGDGGRQPALSDLVQRHTA